MSIAETKIEPLPGETTTASNRIVVVIETRPQFKNLLQIARGLHSIGNWDFTFIFIEEYQHLESDLQEAADLSFNSIITEWLKDRSAKVTFIYRIRVLLSHIKRMIIYVLFPLQKYYRKTVKWLYSVLHYIITKLSSSKFQKSYKFWQARYNTMLTEADNIIKNEDAALLIVPKDSAYNLNLCYVAAARNNGIGTILIPFDDADTETLIEDRIGDKEHQILSKRSQETANKFPKWSITTKDTELLLLSAPQIEALEELNLAPPYPWAYNSSLCDNIFVPDEFEKEKMLARGTLPSQIKVTGAIYHDHISSSIKDGPTMRAALLKRLNMVDDKPLLVASVTPNKFNERDVELEFSSYKDLLSVWITKLTENNFFNVLLSPHPSVHPRHIDFMEEAGARIVTEDVAMLIGLCDLYVVDCSSTSRWALAAGKLVIDYDVFRYNLKFNSDLPGIIHVMDKDSFTEKLNAFAAGELQEEINMVRQRSLDGYWGRLDGNACSRMNSACAELVENKQLCKAAELEQVN